MDISVERKIGMIKATGYKIAVAYCPITKSQDVIINGVTHSCFTDSELDEHIASKYKELVEKGNK